MNKNKSANIKLFLTTGSKYLAVICLIAFAIWGILYFVMYWTLDSRGGVDTRDMFYEVTNSTKIRDSIIAAQVFTLFITVFLIYPSVFLIDLVVRHKILETALLFLVSGLPVLLTVVLINIICFGVANKYFEGDAAINSKIVKLENARIETSDANGNNVPDTIKVHLTLNGDDPRNIHCCGLTAFGGVEVCIKSLVCKHFFYSENQDELHQSRLEVGMRGSTTYVFSIELPKEINLKEYNRPNELNLTANFIGADSSLLKYDTKVMNIVDFNDFESIGVQKLPNEGGLH